MRLSAGKRQRTIASQLLDNEIQHFFEKCNVIDQALHHRNLAFTEFTKVVETELEIALERLSGKLDPAQDSLVFADHGFRLDSAGRRFQHGGNSMLEWIVPVCLMSPRDTS